MPAASSAATSAASTWVARPGCTTRRASAPILWAAITISMPVAPLPMAASVSDTSMAKRRTQASDSSRP